MYNHTRPLTIDEINVYYIFITSGQYLCALAGRARQRKSLNYLPFWTAAGCPKGERVSANQSPHCHYFMKKPERTFRLFCLPADKERQTAPQ